MVGPILLLVGCHSSLNSGTREGGDTGDSAEPTETGETADPDTGPDPDTLDQDDDGFTPNEGDCDDERAHVYPGASDYCDGLDADCDGEPIPDGSCSEVGDPGAMWTWSFESTADAEGHFQKSLGDVDGDGREDVGAWLRSGSETAIRVVSSMEACVSPARQEWEMTGWTDNFPEWLMSDWVASGDTTGDGLADVWLTTRASYGYDGGVFLFPGRDGGLDASLRSIDDAASATWLPGDGSWLSDGYPSPGAGETSGDGRPDMVVRTVDTEGVYRWSPIVAALPDGAQHTLGELPGVFLDTDELEFHGGAMVGDLDGDGLDEGAINIAPTIKLELAYLGGADWVDGAHLLDVGSFAFFREKGSDAYIFVPDGDPGRPGDVNGDGLEDSLLTTYDPVDGVCAILSSGGVPSGNVESQSVARVCSGSEGQNVNPTGWLEDSDGDGSREPLVNAATLIPSARLRAGGSFLLDDVGFQFTQGPGYPRTTADFNGDGYPDWFYDDDSWDQGPPGGMGRSLIIEGFPIPWDDPTKW